jgi:hypothetical protein
MDDGDADIGQEDSWAVISSYFDEKVSCICDFEFFTLRLALALRFHRLDVFFFFFFFENLKGSCATTIGLFR